MSARKDLDRLIQSFLAEGPLELPDPSYDEVRDRMEQKRQRAFIGPWRTPDVSKFVKMGLAAAAVVVLLILGSNLLTGAAMPGGDPSATPEASGRSFVWFDPTGMPEPRTDLPRITVTRPVTGWPCPKVGYDACILISGGGERSLSVPDGQIPESALMATLTKSGIHVYQDACQWEYNLPDPPAMTAGEIAAALAAQPSRDASDPVDVTVGGYPGKEVTLHVPDDLGYSVGANGGVFTDCFRGLYVSYTYGDHDADGTLPVRWHQGPGQIDTFWVIEVNDVIVIFDAMYRADTPAERIDQMRAIVESATFEDVVSTP